MKLIIGLRAYLTSMDISSSDEDSVEAKLIRSIPDEGPLMPTLYSFNYTNLNEIGASLEVSLSTPIYVHGR